MRSRYTAYTRGHIDYIAATLTPEQRAVFDAASAKAWARQAQWQGLRIVSVTAGQPSDATGVVTFVATYRQGNQTIAHREVSQFRRDEAGTWRFAGGDTSAEVIDQGRSSAPLRNTAKVGRNDPCPCGSGRKYKTCCGR